MRAQVEQTAGVGAVGGLGSVQLGARRASEAEGRNLIATTLFGYELAPRGLPADPPPLGQVVADSSIRSDGVRAGDTLLLGPQRSPVEVIGFAPDTRYSGQASLWASLDTWRQVMAANRPDKAFQDGSVQALVVRTAGASPREVAGPHRPGDAAARPPPSPAMRRSRRCPACRSSGPRSTRSSRSRR